MSDPWLLVATIGAATIVLRGVVPAVLGGRPLGGRLLGAIELLPPALLAALVATQVFATKSALVLDERAARARRRGRRAAPARAAAGGHRGRGRHHRARPQRVVHLESACGRSSLAGGAQRRPGRPRQGSVGAGARVLRRGARRRGDGRGARGAELGRVVGRRRRGLLRPARARVPPLPRGGRSARRGAARAVARRRLPRVPRRARRRRRLDAAGRTAARGARAGPGARLARRLRGACGARRRRHGAGAAAGRRGARAGPPARGGRPRDVRGRDRGRDAGRRRRGRRGHAPARRGRRRGARRASTRTCVPPAGPAAT